MKVYAGRWCIKLAISDISETTFYPNSCLSVRTKRNKDGDESAMGVYLSPTSFSSEGDSEYVGQQVACSLTLVQKAAMRGSDEEYTSSEYYDSDEVNFFI